MEIGLYAKTKCISENEIKKIIAFKLHQKEQNPPGYILQKKCKTCTLNTAKHC